MLPTVKQVLLLLYSGISVLPHMSLASHPPTVQFQPHITLPPFLRDPVSRSLPHPSHHAHVSRIIHVKYILIPSLSNSTVLHERSLPQEAVSTPHCLAGSLVMGLRTPQPAGIPLLPHGPSFQPCRRILWALHTQLSLTYQLPM